MRPLFFIIMSFCVLSVSSSALSKDQPIDDKEEEPIYIHGDNGIEIDRGRKEVRAFKGAYVRRGDATLYGNAIYGYYTENKKGKLDLTKAEAFGKVKVITPDKRIQAREGVYDIVKDVILFRGDVRITQEDRHLKGAYATMNRKTGRTTILNYDPISGKKPDIKSQKQVRIFLVG